MEFEYVIYQDNVPFTVWVRVKYRVWAEEIFLGDIEITDENYHPIKLNPYQKREIEDYCYTRAERDYNNRRVDLAEERYEERLYL